MFSDLSVVVISLSVIVLCWAVIRINQKLDEAIHNPHSSNELNARTSDATAGGAPAPRAHIDQT